MTDLPDFLLARIAEDEEAARAAEAGRDRPWIAYKNVQTAACRHMGAWDPARVLAECEAKRRIVELHADVSHECARGDDAWLPVPCPTLRLLALPYADHPDYRQEWRP